MIARRWISILAFLGLPSLAVADAGISLTHYETLERMSLESGHGTGQQKATGIGPIVLRFDALGRTFDLQLEPNANLLAAMVGGDFGDSVPYRGRISGNPDSWARIVISKGMPAGIVFDGENLFALEIPGDAVVETDAPIVYRLADAIIAPGALSCASGSMATSGAAMFKAVVSGLDQAVSQAPGAVSEITVGAVGDYEFTSAKGANAESAILTRLNNVDGIFSAQLGIQISVPVIETFTDVNDPFTDETDPSAFLVEVASYRAATPDQRSQGLTHLYTGRNLDGSTVGIAYKGGIGQGGGLVLCNSNFGAGLSEGNGSANFDSLVAAHEIGHNFGAPHDGEAGSACETQAGDWIMSTRVNGSDQFSPCSIQEMQDDIAAALCITALPNTDISVAFRSATSSVLLGTSPTIVVDVVNNGTEIAQNVSVDVTVPANVSLVSATSAAATCMTGAGTVNCQFGDVMGGTAATIDLATNTASVGSGIFSAIVTADADDQLNNNQDSLQLTVDPAVNLVVNVPASGQVDIDQSTRLTLNLDNLSALDATTVTLSVALNAGIRATSANWSIGSCNVAAQQVDCQAAQFDGQSSATLTLDVTGVAEGSKSYSVTMASAEADSDPSNNTAQGTVRVRVPGGGGGGDDGGGSVGWLFLLTLAGAAILAVRRRGSRSIAAPRA